MILNGICESPSPCKPEKPAVYINEKPVEITDSLSIARCQVVTCLPEIACETVFILKVGEDCIKVENVGIDCYAELCVEGNQSRVFKGLFQKGEFEISQESFIGSWDNFVKSDVAFCPDSDGNSVTINNKMGNKVVVRFPFLKESPWIYLIMMYCLLMKGNC